MNKRIKELIRIVDENGGFAVVADNNRSLLEKQNIIRQLVGRNPLKRPNLDGFEFDEGELQANLPEGYYLVWNECGDLLVMNEENLDKYCNV